MRRKERPTKAAKNHRGRSHRAQANVVDGPSPRTPSTGSVLPRAPEKAIAFARSPSLRKLFVQLSIDPAVRSVSFVESLGVDRGDVPVGMIVADRDDGRVAYDITDERPHRDIDTLGLLLIALENHGIRLVDIDSSVINAEPRAENCQRIWRYRHHPVSETAIERVVSALEGRRRLTIRTLAAIVGLHDLMPTACALICRGIIKTDISEPLSPNSLVSRASDRSLGIPLPLSEKPERGTKP